MNIALDLQSVFSCLAADVDGNRVITVDELVLAVNSAIVGCG